MSGNSSKTRSKDKGDADDQKRVDPIPVTQDDLAALDSAHALTNDRLRLVFARLDEHSSAIANMSDDITKLLAIASGSTFTPSASSTAAQQQPFHSTQPTPSILTASSPTTPTSTAGTAGGGWDSAAAAAAGAGTGRDRSIRLAVVHPDEEERYCTVKPEELGRYDGTLEDAALFIANVTAIRST
ncbi:hypothetical protein V8E36_008838 [Tilletia maclaganii]